MLQRRKKGSFYSRRNKCCFFCFFFFLNHGCQLVAPSMKSDYLSLRFVSSFPPRDMLPFTHYSCWSISHQSSKKHNGEGISHPKEKSPHNADPAIQRAGILSQELHTATNLSMLHRLTQAAYTDGILYQSPHLEDVFFL